jgi:hypothetical protein
VALIDAKERPRGSELAGADHAEDVISDVSSIYIYR